jgi:beta-lactam-binding protein with PASTA domain
VAVPEVINQRVDAAAEQVHARGLQVASPVELVPNPAPLGTVIGQEPPPNTPVKRGSSVRLTVSTGP